MNKLEEAQEILFAKEDKRPSAAGYWKVMIIDDELDIHSTTRMALGRLTFQNKKVHFISAYSEQDAMRLIEEHPDTALILLDVAMEHDDSGLHVVQYIRQTLRNNLVRIILCTGHPGLAPEENLIITYEPLAKRK
ncbi:MAG: response regulator [Nitrospirae bacterium]|nr:response regulator [Nitrospirota bacterium]